MISENFIVSVLKRTVRYGPYGPLIALAHQDDYRHKWWVGNGRGYLEFNSEGSLTAAGMHDHLCESPDNAGCRSVPESDAPFVCQALENGNIRVAVVFDSYLAELEWTDKVLRDWLWHNHPRRVIEIC